MAIAPRHARLGRGAIPGHFFLGFRRPCAVAKVLFIHGHCPGRAPGQSLAICFLGFRRPRAVAAILAQVFSTRGHAEVENVVTGVPF